MKKTIVFSGVSFAILSVIFAVVTFTTTNPSKKIVVQNSVVPVSFVTAQKINQGGVAETAWIVAPGSASLQFYADAGTLDCLISKLDQNSKSHPYTRMVGGKQMKCSWQVEDKDNTVYLKLVYPYGPAARKDNC